jgi:hypothetical protein
MIELISQPTSWSYIKEIASQSFGDMVKAVVDVETAVIALGGELHADEEALLLDEGSVDDPALRQRIITIVHQKIVD